MAPAIDEDRLYYISNSEWDCVLSAYDDTPAVFGVSNKDAAPQEGWMWKACPVVTDHGVPPWRFENVLTKRFLYILIDDISQPQVLTGNYDGDVDSTETWRIEEAGDSSGKVK